MKIVWLAAIPAVVYVLGLVTAQFASGDQFNSAYQRVSWFEQSIEIWQKSPIFGVGMRWWYTDRFTTNFDLFQPNAELEVLTEVGVFGLVGFLAMFAVAGWFSGRWIRCTAQSGLPSSRRAFVQGQFDIYWVAGQASLLWIVAGICYGVQELERARAKRGEPLSWEALPLPPRKTVSSRTRLTPSQRLRAPRMLP